MCLTKASVLPSLFTIYIENMGRAAAPFRKNRAGGVRPWPRTRPILFAAEEPPRVEAANPGGGLMPAAFARTGHKGAGERLAKGSQAPDQAAAKVQFGVGRYALASDAHNRG